MFKKIAVLAGGISLAFIAALGVVSCSPSNPSADGYTFGKKQYEMDEVSISVHTFKNQQEFRAAAKKVGIDDDNVVAFSTIRPPFDHCEIYMIDPAVKYEPEFIGHEFAHCVYGQWHTDNDSRG